MFEREIKFIYDFNLNKISRLGPYFTYEQLATTEIHPAILHYISAEIDYLVFEDRQNLLKNSVFDYSGEKISYHFTQITEELKKNKRFSAEYIAKLILHASSFTINFLIRPKWALTRFVFDEEKHKTSNEIKQILNYVYYYKYLTKILISYINTKKILSMNVEEFEALLNKADMVGIDNYLPAILSNSLKSMAEFFNIGEVKKNRIPLPAVEMFLEEKELLNHLKVLNATFGTDENTRFNLADYHKVLSRVMLEREEAPPVVEVHDEFETSEIEAPEPVEKVVPETEKEVVPDKPEEEISEKEKIESEVSEEETEEIESKELAEENEEPILLDEPIDEEKIDDESKSEEIIEIEGEITEEPGLVSEEQQTLYEQIVDREESAVAEESENVEASSEEAIKGVIEENETEQAGSESETIEPEDESLFHDLFSNVQNKEEVVQEENELPQIEEEIVLPESEDVVIKTPKKFRIRIKDESKVEPIYDEDDSESGSKVDLFKDYSSFTDEADETEKTDDNILAEDDTEKITFFSKDELEEEIDENENIGDEHDLLTAEHEEMAKEEELIFGTPEEEVAEDESEGTVEQNEVEAEPNDFRKLIEEQQSLYDEPELEENDEVERLDDYESDASKKLDERIAEEKDQSDEDSMFDIIKQNFIEGKEAPPKVDLAEILERKEMAKIIEVIFDYDIEDFAGILDEISDCQNVEDAHLVINDALAERRIDHNSKEAETFRKIITEYFAKG
jgi:hypothetical protein